MSVDAGHLGGLYGALNSGSLAPDLLFGRTEPKGPQGPQVVKCMELTYELHDWFRANNDKNSICCRVLTKESEGNFYILAHLRFACPCTYLTS